jgi:hypothetical protein
MKKKTAVAVLVVFIVAAIFLGFLFANKGDGPVAGMILADRAMENTETYKNAAKTPGSGIYIVVSSAFNKFQEDYKAGIPESKDLYAAVRFVECPKGSEYTGKWLKDGAVIREEKGTLTTDAEGVLTYMLEAKNVVKGSLTFALYDGDKKIFEKTFSIE